MPEFNPALVSEDVSVFAAHETLLGSNKLNRLSNDYTYNESNIYKWEIC